MVNYSPALDDTFGALADTTRRAILARLALGELSVTELARPFSISLPAVSRHLRVLQDAGLLVRRKEGRVHYCRLNGEPLEAATNWITRYRGFWEERLDSLERYLQQQAEEETWQSRKPKPRKRSGSRESSRRPRSRSSAPGPTRKH